MARSTQTSYEPQLALDSIAFSANPVFEVCELGTKRLTGVLYPPPTTKFPPNFSFRGNSQNTKFPRARKRMQIA